MAIAEIIWDTAAEQALGGLPLLVRGLVRHKVEERARRHGKGTVTLADFHEAEARFRAVMGGKSADELARMLPRENAPGSEMVLIEACHGTLSNCPNLLIDTAAWQRAVEDWVRESEVSERLRRRVTGDRILFHHKLRIAIAGCPNGCSRPQIAEVGLVGYVRPAVSPAECTRCGACAAACPDTAIAVNGAPPVFDPATCQGCLRCRAACPVGCITLSPPGVRVLLGGKLGRHPHLAEVVDEQTDPAAVIALLDRVVGDYIANALPEERFADYRLRARER